MTVVLEGVFARAREGLLDGVAARFEPGVHVVLGRVDDGLELLCQLLCGRRRPLAGAVRIDGQSPLSPRARRHLGALGRRSHLPRAGTVAGLLSCVERVAGLQREVIARLGAGELGPRRLASLSHAEARGVELGIALAHPAPAALVLYQPFSDIAGVDLAVARERLVELTDTVTLIASDAPADVAGLTDRVQLLDRGRLVGVAPCPGALLVEIDGDGTAACALAGELSRDGAAFDGVDWCRNPSRVTVHAADVAEAALRVAAACARLSSPVIALRTEQGSLDALRARVRSLVATPPEGEVHQ